MAKFKVGDKVKCVDDTWASGYIKVGNVYEIISVGTAANRQWLELAGKARCTFGDYRFELSEQPIDRITDLENQIETWKRLQKTNEATIRLWQDIHQKDQQCLILFAKRLNKVTAENVELKRKIAEEVRENKDNEEYKELREIMRALKDVK